MGLNTRRYMNRPASYIGAIDQGTTSTRFFIFDRSTRIVTSAQAEHQEIYPRPGWVEQDPDEIWRHTQRLIEESMHQRGLQSGDLAAISIANQRETTVLWHRRTGKPVANAIVWQDTRTADYVSEMSRRDGPEQFRSKTGLPLATYFSALKIRWILDNVAGVRERAQNGDVLFGNIDTFLLWNLTGGPNGGIHATDVTNASRTMLMDLETLDWDDELLGLFGIPRAMLPKINSSSHPDAFGTSRTSRPLNTPVPITGVLGDQQAATVGQVCFA